MTENERVEEEIVLTGDYFGYPRCCSQAFVPIILIDFRLKTPAQLDPVVHRGTGFIPCPKHAEEILAGKITLESLITNRVCRYPFPEDGGIKDFLAIHNYIKNKRYAGT